MTYDERMAVGSIIFSFGFGILIGSLVSSISKKANVFIVVVAVICISVGLYHVRDYGGGSL